MKVNQKTSQEIAALIKATPEAGWHNAFTALFHLPEARYVEGWAVSLETFNRFEHAWLVQADQIVDPTLWDHQLVYFPALYFTVAQARTAFASRQRLPLCRRPGWRERDSPAASQDPAYWAAWEAASKFAEGRKRAYLWRAWRRWVMLVNERW